MRAYRLLEVETMQIRLDDSLGTPVGPHLRRRLHHNVWKRFTATMRKLALR